LALQTHAVHEIGEALVGGAQLVAQLGAHDQRA
jgi:hypothetical protein